MKNTRYTMVDLVIGAYVLLPTFFRVGPVSVYQLLIIGVFALYILGPWRGQIRAGFRTVWAIRVALLFVPMLYHRELAAMIIYAVTPGLLGVLLYTYVRDRADVNRLIDVLIYSSVINFLICIVESVTGVNLSYLLCTDGTAVYEGMERLGIMRVFGAFINPINNGVFCIFALILCLYRIGGVSESKIRRRIWWIYACNWVVLFLTFGRAAILIGLIANLFLLYKAKLLRMNLHLFLAILVLLFGVVLLVTVPNTLTDKIEEMILPFFKIIDDLLGTDIVTSIAGSAQVEGIGNRLDLYKWVPASMDNLWFGEGRAAKFSYVINQFGHAKESIENQYLYELYTHGIISLCGKILMFASMLLYSLKWAIKEWRMKLTGFNTYMLVAYAAYFAMLFTVAQNEERKVFYILAILQVLYNTCASKDGQGLRKEGFHETY